jgi:Conserved mid region of cactin
VTSRRPDQERPQFRAEQEDQLYQEWLGREDEFMLTQTKKRAVIRVREGRAQPIDAFVINLKLIKQDQKQRVLGDDEVEGDEFYITEPDEVIEPLSVKEMDQLFGDINEYLGMEKSQKSKDFWNVSFR